MPALDFEAIDRLKREYTDKYVVADASTPELARFRGQTGQVKTVNMSGRALVEFEGNNDIGWHDIHLAFLKVVDKPAPKPAESKEEKKANPAAKGKQPSGETGTAGAAPKAAGEKKLSPIEMARAQAAAKKAGGAPAAAAPAAAGKPSTADILAAARAKKEGGAPAAAAPAAKPAAPATGGKPSTADILAAARGKAAAPAAAPKPAAPKPEPAKAAAPAPAPVEETVEEAPPAEPAPVAEKKAPAGALPKDVPGILAFCREHDGK